jgi:group I intron endonuclease
MIVYRALNKINCKSYVGITQQDLSKRVSSHCRAKSFFGRAIRKYGLENFEWYVLEDNLDKEDAFLAEEWFIRYYRSFWKLNGYNLTYGGDGIFGYKFVVDENWSSKRPEVRRKISQSVRKNSKMRGNTHTKNAKRKISEAAKNMWKMDGYKENFARKMSGNKHPMYGKHHTNEAKEKIRNKSQRFYEISKNNVSYTLKSSELRLFCVNNNLSYQMILRRLKLGLNTYKDYKIYLLIKS